MPTTWTIGHKITVGFALSLLALFVAMRRQVMTSLGSKSVPGCP